MGIRARSVGLIAAALSLSGCLTLTSDWHETKRINVLPDLRSVENGGESSVAIELQGDAARIAVTEQPLCRPAQFGHVDVTEERVQSLPRWPVKVLLWSAVPPFPILLTLAVLGQVSLGTKSQAYGRDIVNGFWAGTGLALSNLIAGFILSSKLPWSRVKERHSDGGPASEWTGPIARCGGPRPGAHHKIRITAEFAGTGRNVYWVWTTGDDGAVTFPTRGPSLAARYCGASTIVVADETTAAPTAEDAPSAPSTSSRPFATVRAGIPTATSGALGDITDRAANETAQDCAQRTSGACIASKRGQFGGECEQQCAQQLNATRCLVERTDCESLAANPDQRALCPSFLKECLMTAGIAVNAFQGCIDHCTEQRAAALCQVH
jgi:hypothetical protein